MSPVAKALVFGVVAYFGFTWFVDPAGPFRVLETLRAAPELIAEANAARHQLGK